MLFVHIGTQKTGSSALQAYLAEHADLLLNQGIHYLKTGRARSHGDLAHALHGRADMALWQRVREEIQASNSPTKIISAEGLWVTDPILLKNELPDALPVRIVVYLRRQDQYLQSLWKQAIAGGRKTDFDTWLEERMSRGDYLSTIERWASAFGAESLIVRPYERPDGANTVADFCQVIGAVGLPEAENVRRNFSPRRELAHFMRALNNADARMNHRNMFRAIIEKNSDYIRSCDMLSNEAARELMQNYTDSNRLVVERYYRNSLPQLFPELTDSSAPEIWTLDSQEFFQLTLDVLDVLIAQCLAGKVSDRRLAKKSSRAERRAHRSARRLERLESAG